MFVPTYIVYVGSRGIAQTSEGTRNTLSTYKANNHLLVLHGGGGFHTFNSKKFKEFGKETIQLVNGERASN